MQRNYFRLGQLQTSGISIQVDEEEIPGRALLRQERERITYPPIKRRSMAKEKSKASTVLKGRQRKGKKAAKSCDPTLGFVSVYSFDQLSARQKRFCRRYW